MDNIVVIHVLFSKMCQCSLLHVTNEIFHIHMYPHVQANRKIARICGLNSYDTCSRELSYRSNRSFSFFSNLLAKIIFLLIENLRETKKLGARSHAHFNSFELFLD